MLLSAASGNQGIEFRGKVMFSLKAFYIILTIFLITSRPNATPPTKLTIAKDVARSSPARTAINVVKK